MKPRVLPFDVISIDPDTGNKDRADSSGRWTGWYMCAVIQNIEYK